jgi:hypothetical protein
MGLTEIGLLIYAGIAAWAMLMTRAERQAAGSHAGGPLYAVAGYAACLFWPLTLACILIVAARRPQAA